MTNSSVYVTFIEPSFNKLWTLDIDSLVSVLDNVLLPTSSTEAVKV